MGDACGSRCAACRDPAGRARGRRAATRAPSSSRSAARPPAGRPARRRCGPRAPPRRRRAKPGPISRGTPSARGSALARAAPRSSWHRTRTRRRPGARGRQVIAQRLGQRARGALQPAGGRLRRGADPGSPPARGRSPARTAAASRRAGRELGRDAPRSGGPRRRSRPRRRQHWRLRPLAAQRQAAKNRWWLATISCASTARLRMLVTEAALEVGAARADARLRVAAISRRPASRRPDRPGRRDRRSRCRRRRQDPLQLGFATSDDCRVCSYQRAADVVCRALHHDQVNGRAGRSACYDRCRRGRFDARES